MNAVSIRKQHVTMDDYYQGPLNPHPVFPQWSVWSVYPHQFYGQMRKFIVKHKFYMPTIENEFLRVTVAPDIGGRIWDVYDKIGGRHVANWNTEVRTYQGGFGLNYTTGGIECNYPLAHSPTTSRQREVSTRQYPDGSASVIVSELDRIWRTRWAMECRLYPNRAYVEQRVRIYNRTPHESRYMYWNNCGWVLGDGGQFIFPESTGAMHGMEDETFSWPIWKHRDLSWFRENPDMLGLYMLNVDEPYLGYYDHDEDFGLVHYGDVADLPGRKTWTWGNVPDNMAHMRKTHHSRDEVYGEVQSGRLVIQEHRDRMPPESECQWYERWYPVRGIGGFNGAGPGAAMNLEVVPSGRGQSRLRLKTMANAPYPGATATLTSEGAPPVEKILTLGPTDAVESIFTVKGSVGPDRKTKVTLRDRDGVILGVVRLPAARTRDSWREVADLTREIRPVGVEEIFREAEKKARDWGNHDLRPLYEKVIAQDEGFSPARRELGRWAIWQGLYDEAIEHLDIAIERDPDSFELRYLRGLALVHGGRLDEARAAFELANRYQWEAASLARLAELRMREGDWEHAGRHLDRLAGAFPRLTRLRGLRAACLRRLGRKKQAQAEIDEALAIDADDPFLQVEAMFIRAGGVSDKRLPPRAVKSLIEQVREAEWPLLEAAFDYLAAGLDEEARAVLEIIPKPGPLALFVLARVHEKGGRSARARQVLATACKADPVTHCAWRLEMLPVLEWAREQLPKHPRPLLHLGNLLMARRRTEEAVALWRKAEQLGEKNYLLHASLGFHAKTVAGKPKAAAEHFRKAAGAEPADLYVKRERFTALRGLGKDDEAVRLLEGDPEALRLSPVLTHDLLNVYLERNDYAKFDRLCAEVSFPANWNLAGPCTLWHRRFFEEALVSFGEKDPKRALAILRDIPAAPARLGVPRDPWVEEPVRRYYHMGRMCEKLGDMQEARRCWEKALGFDYNCYFEPGYWTHRWTHRYYQALSLQKLGRESQANTVFDGMELLAHSPELPVNARDAIMDLVERGRFVPDEEKDPVGRKAVKVRTRAEE